MTPPDKALLLAVDCGATWTKAAVVEVVGTRTRIRVVATAAGTNPNVSGAETARTRLSELLQKVLQAAGGAVDAACIGAAGTPAAAAAVAEEHLRGIPIALPSDSSLPAYCSPGWRTTGAVALVAGTGSMAARTPPGQVSPATVAGGWGWFLGDDAGGVGIGRDIARAVLRDLQGGPETLLTQMVADQIGGSVHRTLASRIYRNFYQDPGPQRAASALAPLLTPAAQERDPAATRIRDQAVETLIGHARALAKPGDHVAAAGSVALALAEHLKNPLEELFGRDNVLFTPDGVIGGIAAAADLLDLDLSTPDLLQDWIELRENMSLKPDSRGGATHVEERS